MKKIIYTLTIQLSIFFMTQASNPLLGVYKTPHQTFPFDKIKTEHYEPAFDKGITELEREIVLIAANKEKPSFKNTVVALENSGELLERVMMAFFPLLSAESDDEMMEIAQRISPKLTEVKNNIFLNEALFNRFKTVYEQKNTLNLTTEDARLLEKNMDDFRNNGANLSPEGKAKFRELSVELSKLMVQFSQNTLKDKNRYELLITDKSDLTGIPESILEGAAMEAKEKGETGWLFTLSAPSYIPFLQYADNRSLREKIYLAYLSTGNKGDEFDNQEVIRQIVNTRLAVAQLMGFENFAAYTLQDKMAKNPNTVNKLLEELLRAYKPVGDKEYQEVQAFASELVKGDITVMPWDWSYFSEKLKSKRFDVNDEMTRPYFELQQVTQGILGLTTRLFGLTYKEVTNIPLYHPEVETYEVYDENNQFLAVLYTDFFPRKGKQSGAWMTDLRPQYKDGSGKDHRPHVAIVMNFSRPTETLPSLLTYDEVNTFLHEFGHALHGMLSHANYATLSGTNVARDFVELPSQIMENWLHEEEFLNSIAKHYETGEKIPTSLTQKLINASNFNEGYKGCRQVSFGLLDMSWHTLEKPYTGSVSDFEQAACSEAAVLPVIPGAIFSTAFNHIFTLDYSAGYYSYKWSEVLDADAFSVFKKKGIFNIEVAKLLRDEILSRGSTEDSNILYRNFRGQDPTIDALLIRSGIKTECKGEVKVN